MIDNYKLLEKHKKKLSIYFALFILLSLWLTEGIFLGSTFFANNLKLDDKLEIRYSWVINVISNMPNYLQKNDDLAVKTILEKTLEWVTIFKNWEKILWEIKSYNLWNNNTILNSQNYKYYQKTYSLNQDQYKIIIKTENEFSYSILFSQYLYFVIFTIPFLIIFYLIWYKFVWKNLKPIEETIESLETFSGNINHEMKTPLTEIISTLSLTKETKNNYENAINESLNSAKKLDKILDSMLWIINLVDCCYKKQKINLISEINEIIKENQNIIEKKNIKLETNFKNKKYYLYTNKEHFDICVWNILKNAIKYSFDNSVIKINFDDWIVEIIDNWIWIERKNLKNIFNRYFRESYTKSDWYGLWLALVKKITDINKWKIEIESEKNIWTKVVLNFN